MTIKWFDDIKTIAKDTTKNLTRKSKKLISDTWEKGLSLTHQATEKGKNLINISTDEEIAAVKSDLQELAPSAKNTISTLMHNSKFKKGVQLPPQDELCAKITSYSYMAPEKRPYQVDEYYLEPTYNTPFHCIYL